MARKGILSGGPVEPPARRPVDKPAPRGAVGALQSSLSRMQENAVQDIDTALIDDAGMEDRLELDSEAQAQLKDSLLTYGQQVPVLLRPSAKTPGRFEIVYGRRRLKALRDLGQPVKAMIRQLDDQALVMAQGQENTSRQDLTFIEKASFAAQLIDAGYNRETVAAALSIDLPMVSRMLTAGQAFPLHFLKRVGSAPGIGRDRWLALAKLMRDKEARDRITALFNSPDLQGTSDEKFELLFAHAKNSAPKPAAPKAVPLRTTDGQVLGDMKHTAKGVTVTIPTRNAPGFDEWVATRMETAIQVLYDDWQKSSDEQ